MLFERIESKGIAHFSYIIGDGAHAIVIDPRRDVDIYTEITVREGMRITHILETHRNEDYTIGSLELEARTGAEIWHADGQLEYQYGSAVKDGQEFKAGRILIRAIHTPGHTEGSMSYLAHTPDANGAPWILFCGDVLFAGDVGRTDLLGMDRAEEMTGFLYDTIFEKFLTLGDEVIVCPAHGAGSVCGSLISDRAWTTIGLERKLNPKLQYHDRGEFIAGVMRELERPPYFSMMEILNMEGPPVIGALPVLPALSVKEFNQLVDNPVIVDTRMELGFGAAHVPGAISIWMGGLGAFAGWFLPYDVPVMLVNETADPSEAMRILFRLGYDNIGGYLAGGMLSWHMSGIESETIETMTVQELCREMDRGEEPWILDIRSEEEIENQGEVPGAQNIHLTQLQIRAGEVPADRAVTIFCGSGMRSMTAASLLRRMGRGDLRVVLGGLMGWRSQRCPINPKA